MRKLPQKHTRDPWIGSKVLCKYALISLVWSSMNFPIGIFSFPFFILEIFHFCRYQSCCHLKHHEFILVLDHMLFTEDISSLDMSIKVETTSMFALHPLHFDKIGTSRSWLHLLHLQQFTSNKWMGMAYFAFLTFTMIMRNSLHIIRHLNWLWMRHNLNFSSWIPIIVFKQVKSFP